MEDKYGQTPVHAAFRGGNLRSLELLLRMGARVDIRDKQGRTPQFLLTISTPKQVQMSIAIMRTALDNSEQDVNAVDGNRCSQQTRVAKSYRHYIRIKNPTMPAPQLDFMRTLVLEYGADLHIQTVDNSSALSIIADVQECFFLLEHGEQTSTVPQYVAFLCSIGLFRLAATYGSALLTPPLDTAALKKILQYTCTSNTSPAIEIQQNILRISEIPVNELIDGRTMLNIALAAKNDTAVKILCRSRADINLVDAHGDSALEQAVNSSPQVLEQQLELSLDDVSMEKRVALLNEANLELALALSKLWGVYNSGYEVPLDSLVTAYEQRNVRLLLAAQFSKNRINLQLNQSNGCSIVHSAVYNRDIVQVELQLLYVCDVNIVDQQGVTLLGQAAENADTHMAALLLHGGANPMVSLVSNPEEYAWMPFLLDQQFARIECNKSSLGTPYTPEQELLVALKHTLLDLFLAKGANFGVTRSPSGRDGYSVLCRIASGPKQHNSAVYDAISYVQLHFPTCYLNQDENGGTYLLALAQSNNHVMIAYLLKHGKHATFNVKPNLDGDTIIHHATKALSVSMCQKLGVDPFIQGPNACAFYAHILKGNLNIVEDILSYYRPHNESLLLGAIIYAQHSPSNPDIVKLLCTYTTKNQSFTLEQWLEVWSAACAWHPANACAVVIVEYSTRSVQFLHKALQLAVENAYLDGLSVMIKVMARFMNYRALQILLSYALIVASKDARDLTVIKMLLQHHASPALEVEHFRKTPIQIALEDTNEQVIQLYNQYMSTQQQHQQQHQYYQH